MRKQELNVATIHPVIKKRRRKFTGEYKLHVLHKTDAMKTPRQVREFLNQERLFPSTLNRWRKERVKHLTSGIPSKKRGRKKISQDTKSLNRVLSLEKQIQHLKLQLKNATVTIREQKKRIRTSIHTKPF